MIAMLLVAYLVGQQPAGANTVDISKNALNEKSSYLKASFREVMQEVFYQRRQSAEAAGEYPMLKLLIEMAKMEVSHNKLEQEALTVAKYVIEQYFTAENSENWPPKTRGLADLIASRLIQRACDRQLDEQQTRRKRIYLLLKHFYYDAGIRELAREYSMRMKGKEARAAKAQAILDRALRQYKRAVSDQFPAPRVSTTLESIDSMIFKAKSSLMDPFRGVGSNDRVSLDIASTESKLMDKLPQMSISHVDQVKMEKVIAYENSQAQSYIDDILNDVNRMGHQLDDQFEQLLRNILYEPQQKSEADRDYPLMAISAHMAKCSALLYTSEKRMVRIVHEVIKQYSIEKAKPLKGSLVANKNLIDIIIKRATERAIREGFAEIEYGRKRLFLLLIKYDNDRYIKEMARKFFQYLQGARHRLATASATFPSLKRYKNDVSFVLTESVSDTLNAIDELIERAVMADSLLLVKENLLADVNRINLNYLLAKFVQSHVVDSIRSAEQRTASQLSEIDPKSIKSVDMEEVLVYEELTSKLMDIHI